MNQNLLKSKIHLFVILAGLTVSNSSLSQVQHVYGQFCVGSFSVFAYTGPGSVSSWYVSGGGTITNNYGNSIQVQWNSTASNVYVSANYNTGWSSGTAFYSNIYISSSVTPSVSISASSINICAGTSVTFTATPTNGGSSPYYSWYINGSFASGGSGNTYSTSSLTNGQQVSCVMSSNASCVTSSSATSNSISITVNTRQNMNVTISGTTSVCQGSGTSFGASVANAVGNLTYQWKKNGVNTSSDAATPAYVLVKNTVANGDVFSCDVTSDGCANPATSNSLTISTLTPQNFTIAPYISVITYCPGAPVNFSVNASHSAYNYQWYMNGAAVPGANSPTFTTTAMSVAQLQSVTVSAYTNALCVNNTYASGSVQHIPFVIYSPPGVTGNFSVISGSSTTLTASGNTPNFRWYDATGTQVYQGSQYATPTTLTPGYYTYQIRGVNSDGTCLTDPVSITVTVNFPIVTYTDLFNSSNFIKTIDLTKPIGTVGGATSTTPSGGITYSVPIYTPPGTNGMQPSIGIAYNSQSGNGAGGNGWNISGLSVISRTGKSIYSNGLVMPVTYTADDVFLLDGMKLNTVSGTNGANNTVYATEVETFSRIISYTSASANNPDWFQITGKNGSIMEFGHTADSRILTDNGTSVMFWRLNKIIDANGNYVEFKYDNGFRDSRIDEINYTGNALTGLLPYNQIKFSYKGRNDINTIYDGGGSLTSKSLLTNVTVKHDNQLVKAYQLNYGFDNITSLLKEIIESGSDGTALNSTIFLYGDQPQNLSITSTVSVVGSNLDFFSGDFDADGKTDLLKAQFYYQGTSPIRLHSQYELLRDVDAGSSVSMYNYALPAQSSVKPADPKKLNNFLTSDFNKDGRDDILLVNSNWTGSENLFTKININYTGSFNPSTSYYNYTTSQDFPIPTTSYTYNRISTKGNFFIPGDFDGDGNQDYMLDLGRWDFSYVTDFTLFITSPATNDINKYTEGISTSYGIANTIAFADLVQPIDMDGDGKTEILAIKDGQSYVFQTRRNIPGSTFMFTASELLTTSEMVKDDRVFPGDFNGDRKTDLLVRKVNGTWKILYSTGTTFISTPFSFNQSVSITGSETDHVILVSDFNGDGKSDILHGFPNGSTASYLSLYYSVGTGSANPFYYEQYNYNQTMIRIGVVTGDFNGDGRSDLLNRYFVNSPADFISFKSMGQERLLKRVTDGHNTTTSFDYKLLTDKTTYPYFYDRTISLDDPANQNPYNYVQLPMFAVSSVTEPDGIGGSNITSFNYENAVAHRTGKGFLGFKKITTKNMVTGITAIAENEINTQFATLYITKQTSKITSTSELLSESQITTAFNDLSTGTNDKRYFTKTDKVININHLAGTANEITNVYDNYGNITTQVSKSGTLSGVTVNALETVTTTTALSIHNTPVPSKPDNITVTKTRTGASSQNSTTTFVYSTNGLLSSTTEFAGLPKAVTTAYTYDGFGNTTSVTTSATGLNNRITTFTYDPTGRFVISKQLSGNGVSQTETHSYDAGWGKLLSQTSSDCVTTTFEYDGFGRLKKTNLPEGFSVTTSLNWDVQGENVFYSFIDYPGGSPDIKTWFDKLGRETKKQTLGFNNQWITQLTSYNVKGNVATQTNGYYSSETPLITTNTYDPYGRLVNAANTLTSVTNVYTRLSNGRMQVVTSNTSGHSATKISDATGKVITAIDEGGQLDFTYDSWGNQTQVMHGSIVLTTSTYDSYGKQTSLADKNAGTVTYDYDAFGQLKQQTDNIGNSYSMSYDDLGRIVSRQGPEGTTTYEYYKDIATGCSNNSLSRITAFNGILKQYTFDNLKRPQTEQVTIDGTTYTTQYAYNSYSKLTQTTYPSGVVVNNNYDGNGEIISVTGGNASSPTTLFTANQKNGFGQTTNYTLGNNKTSQNTYYYGTATRFYTQGVQDLNLTFNYTTGNLMSRQDAIKNISENFQYDALNRLNQASVNGTVQLNMSYDGNSSFSMGNIISKTDAGNYVYSATKIHAVNYITNPAGAQVPPAMISTNQQLISYTPFLKTSSITEGIYQLDYTYDADYERVKSVLKQNNSVVETKYYFGQYEKQISGGVVREIHYVSSGNGLCAIIEKENGVNNYYFVYTDHLGSILTLTDINGNVVAEQNFDAWGRNRIPATWQYGSPPTVPAWLYRGFTGHEHLPQFVLINMNGRVYDPIQGRMLSPDNYVANPFATQGYNRYSYANNNPLTYVDPDGNFAFAPIIIGAMIGAFFGGIHADMQGQPFLSGAWKGALVGAVGGSLGQLGSGSFIAQTLWGAGEGAITGGLNSILFGENFGSGLLTGAAWGAAFGVLSATTESLENAGDGYGFGTNDGRMAKMLSNKQYDRLINYARMRFGLNDAGWTTIYSEYEFKAFGEKGKYDAITIFDQEAETPKAVTFFYKGSFKSLNTFKQTFAHEYGHFKGMYKDVNLGLWTDADPELWNYMDGSSGYAQEIKMAGTLHINRSALTDFQKMRSDWLYIGQKNIMWGKIPKNPVWYSDLIKGKFFKTLPIRYIFAR